MDQLTKTILAWERRLERPHRSNPRPAPDEESARAKPQRASPAECPRVHDVRRRAGLRTET